MFKRVLFLALLVASLLAMTGCGDGGTIKIAHLGPLSGDVATFGESTKNGVALAVEEWNANGGVNGKQIEVINEDSQCAAEPAVSAGNKVIDQDGVKFIIGEVCSSATIPLSEVAVAKGVFLISPTATNPAVTVAEDGSTKDGIFRACFIDPFQGKVAAKFAMDNLGSTAAVFLDQGNDYVKGLAEVFIAEFEALGGEVVVTETYTGEDVDFSAILTKAKDADPDIIYVPDYYSTVNLIAAQAMEMGITAPMFGADGWDSPDLDTSVVQGSFFTNHFSVGDTREVVVEFVAKYTEKYGKAPDALAVLAYDAANILFQAMEATESFDPAEVAAYVETGSFPVVSGDVSYDEFHNPVKAAVVLQVDGDGFTYVDTLSP